MVIPDLALTRVGQLGIVVRDIQASMEHYWRVLGVGPWKVYTNGPPPLRNVTYYGRPASYRVRVALAQTESVVIELIQFLEGDSIHRDFLAAKGEGIEHVGVYVANLDEPLTRLRNQGLTVLQSADGLGALGDGRYAYLDTRFTLGTILELIQAPSLRVEPELTYP